MITGSTKGAVDSLLKETGSPCHVLSATSLWSSPSSTNVFGGPASSGLCWAFPGHKESQDTAALLEDLTHKQGVAVTVSKGCGRGMPGGLCFLFHIIFIKILKTEQMTKIPLVQSALFISILQPSRAERRRGEKKTVLGPGSLH